MVLYELITLKLPFEQLDTCDIITAVLEGEAVPSLEMDDSIREKYWQLVELHRRCTAFNPSDRPAWTDILRSLHFIRRGADEKPAPLLSQKSQLSLSDQLNLYNTNGNISMSSHPGDLLSPHHRPSRPPPAELPEALPAEFEMPEPSPSPTISELPETPKSEPEPYKNATLRFRGVHSANTDTNEEESESETHEEQSDSETSESSTIRNRLMVRKVIVEIRNEQGDVIREQLQEERSIEAAAKKGVQNISSESSPVIQTVPVVHIGESPARKKKKKIKRDRSLPSSIGSSLSSPDIALSREPTPKDERPNPSED